MDEFLTVKEVAGLLKLNEQTLRNMIDRGELPAVRVGSRRVRIRRSDLDAFLGAGETKPVADEDALREQFRVSLDDARAAVGDDARVGVGVAQAGGDAAQRLAGQRLGSGATRRPRRRRNCWVTAPGDVAATAGVVSRLPCQGEPAHQLIADRVAQPRQGRSLDPRDLHLAASDDRRDVRLRETVVVAKP